MKTKILLSFLILFTSLRSMAEDPNNAVLANLGAMPFGVYELSYDRVLDKNTSLSSTATYYDTRKVLLTRIFSYGFMFSLGFSPKFHIYGQALQQSFYLAPSINAGYLNHPNQEIKESILLRIGGKFGFAHVFSSGLALDFSAGIERYHNFYFTKALTDLQTEKDTGSVFRPALAAAIGYAF